MRAFMSSAAFKGFVLAAGLALTWLVLSCSAHAQEAQEQNVKLNLNGASLKEVIKLMETYTGRRYLFDENTVAGKRVNLFSSKPIPVESMSEVFEAILEVEGLTLLETGEPGSKIYKIIDIQTALKRPMPTYSKAELEKLRAGDQIVTLMYQLEYASADEVSKVMSGLTTLPGGVMAVPGTNLVQVTDFAANVKRIAGLLELIDQKGPKVVMETIRLQNVAPEALVQEIQPILDVENRVLLNQIQQNFSRQVTRMLGQRRQPGLVQFSALQYSPVTVVAIPRLASVIVSCEETRMEGIKQLVSRLDVVDPDQKLIKYYKIQYADPQSIAQVLSSIFDITQAGQSGQAAFRRDRQGRMRRVPQAQQTTAGKSAVVIADENLRTLVIVASKDTHAEIEKVIKELDVVGPADAVLRFYRVGNTDLHKTAEVISALFQLSLSTQVDQLRQLMQRFQRGRRGGPAITQEHIILPDENLNSLLIVAPVEVHEKIKEAIDKIDVIGPGDKKVKYYALEHADPAEVARLLGSIFDITVGESGAQLPGGRRGGRQQPVLSKASKNAVILASEDQAKVIVVADDATHVEIEKVIKDLDLLGPNESVVRYYVIRNADLEATAKIVSQIFGLSEGGDNASQMLQQMRRRRAAPQSPTVAQTNTVIIDENLDSLIVVAPLKLQQDIEETIKTLDVIGPGERVVQYYEIENADVDEMAQTLGSIFGITVGSAGGQTAQRGRGRRVQSQVKVEKTSIIIPNAELGQIVVVASKPVQEEVAKVIKSLDVKGPNESVVAYYPIDNADLNETASIISQIFSLTLGSVETGSTASRARGRTQGSRTGQTVQVNTVIADENLNSLVVMAPQKLQDEIKDTVAKLDVVGPGERIVEYYKIQSAQVAELAKTLSSIFDLQVEDAAASTRGRSRAAARGGQTQVKAEKKPVIIPQPELATIVVVASKPVQDEVAVVIANLDTVGPQTNVVEYYRLEYTDIEETANILSQIFGIKVGSPGTAYRSAGRGAATQETRKLTAEKVIIPDDNLNNVIVVAPKEVQEEVKKTLAVVDVVGPRDNELRFYEVDNTQVESAAQILSQLYNIPMGSPTQQTRRSGRSKTTTKKYGVDPVIIPDSDLGSIVINAPADIHEEVEKVLEQLRFLGTQERMTIKFYKLKNTDAEEIADKIGSLFGISVAKMSTTTSAKSSSSGRSSTSSMPMPSSSTGRTTSRRISSAMGAPKPFLNQDETGVPEEEEENMEGEAADAKKEFQYGGEPVVVPDKNLNSIIVIAPEYVHEEIDKIILKLDQRRPQVMFEVAIIDVSGDRELDLGIEWTAVDNPDDGARGAGFTNLGVGERQGGTTGFPRTTRVPTTSSGLFAGITKGTYGNIPLLLRVLATNSDVNIRSTPILLVNDNEEASFSSLISEPTTSTSQGTATTKVSFSGFVDAGTVLQLTPHISEGDYIRLEIMLQADTWLGASMTPGIPPAKATNYVNTMITVPNNRTVIIGGLTSDSLTTTRTGVPILMSIPLLGQLFRYDRVEKKRSKLYLFVRPVILSDEEFEDLNRISRDKYEEAMGLRESASAAEEQEEKESVQETQKK